MYKGSNKGHLGGLDKVFKIRDHHHRIHRQILRQNEGLIPALASATVFLLLTDEQAPSLKLAEGRCRRQRPEAVTKP